MKFLRENIEDVSIIIEETGASNKKNYYVEGIFIQGSIPNRNRRIYPMNVLEKEVDRYINESINTKRALGELGHPESPNINLPLVSHNIESLVRSGNDYIGKAKILDTPNGRIVKNLLDEQIKIGMSTRGMGSLVERNGIMEVQSDLRFATAGDIVFDPSAPNALMNGIMEGRDWIFNEAANSWVLEELTDKIKKSGKKLDEQKALSVFNMFINEIKSKFK